MATISVARYWVAGLAGGGDSGFEALEGLARTVGAALFLALWPWLFDTAVNLANLASSGLMGAASVTDDSARLLVVGLGAAGALNLTADRDVPEDRDRGRRQPAVPRTAAAQDRAQRLDRAGVRGMPAAVVLWPMAPWVTRVARARSPSACSSRSRGRCASPRRRRSASNALGFNGGTFMDKLLEPLVAIVLLFVMLTLPLSLARVAMLGGQALSGGFVSRAVSYAAGRSMTNAAGQHLPAWAGGQATKQSDTQRRA